MRLRTMSSAVLAASLVAAFALAGAHLAPKISPAAGGGIEIHAARPPGAHLQPAAPGVTQTYSNNWSGYEQVDTNTQVFTAVKGTWTVPTVTTGPGVQSSCDWVGIDGASNKTLIQVGTDSDNVGGTAVYTAWTEILPAKQDPLSLVINPGDKMEGLVEQTGARTWAMTLKDLTTGKSNTIPTTYITPQQDVEAIHERTTVPGTTSALAKTTNVTQFPDYYSTAPPGTKPVWTALGKAAPGAVLDQVFMTNNSGTKIIASPSTLNSAKNGFTVADGSKSPPPPADWKEIPGPLPAGVTNASSGYSSLACAALSACVVAGGYAASGVGEGLLLTGSGASWQTADAPLPANARPGQAPTLPATACPGPSACVAVGYYPINGSKFSDGLLLTGLGSSWTQAQAPVPADANPGGGNSLRAVACPAVDYCIAVGHYDDTTGKVRLLIETGFGTSWTPLGVALPPNYANSLEINAVTCPTTTTCVAAGVYADALNDEQGLLLTLSGGSWTASDAPLPADAQPSLYTDPITSLACPSTSECFAVGRYRDLSNNTQALLLTMQGSTWTAKKAPMPSNARSNPSAILNAISCPSTSACVSVGYYADQTGETQGLILTMSGTSWRPAEAPLPANAATSGYGGIAILNSASCTSATRCVAAGTYMDTSGEWQGLLLNKSDSQWGATETPLPRGTSNITGGGEPIAVACLSATQCEAIGYYAQEISNPDQYQTLLISGPG
jgi:hypothetical protein